MTLSGLSLPWYETIYPYRFNYENKSSSQLLGVLAHEIGHIAAGHLIRRRDAIGDSQKITAIGLVLGSLAAATTQSGR